MTTREAYDSDLTFRALVDVWVAERRCPLVLKDRCLELDLPGAAACAEWAATEPDRKPPWPKKKEKKSACGPFPTLCEGGWYWQHNRPLSSAADVPRTNVPYSLLRDRAGSNYQYRQHETPLGAILWLLDNWQIPTAKSKARKPKPRTASKAKRAPKPKAPPKPRAPRRGRTS